MEFKPGAYTKGDIVTVNGIQYVADRDILSAQALPKENMYWSVVGPVEQIPPPPPIVIGTDLVPDLLPTNTPEQNSAAIEKHLSLFPYGACPTIKIPSGNYHFARRIEIDSKPVHLFGDNGTIWGNGTRLIFPDGSDGIWIERTKGFQGTIIENLAIIAQGKTTPWKSGIRTTARVTLRGIHVKGFGHNGIDFWSNMDEGTDSSGSWVEHCHSLENVNDGFFAGRTDANAITFIGNDARDNGRYGFHDDSFLGNNYISCMCHYNKQGDFFVRDWGNARSGFQLCYTESGNTVSSLGPKSTVVGGLWGSGYNKNDGKGIIYT
jgi:hypothetical protein